LIGGFGRLGGSIVALAGSAGFGLLVKSSFDTIDDLAKVADSLGITTEALAGLRRASELSGVGADKLDKSLLRMQRRISEAADGSLLARDNLRQMGLSLDEIRGLSPEEQFIKVASAIRGVADQTDRTRLAFDTFGRDGAKVLKIVEKGAAATRSEIAKAAELGLAPSREDAAKVEAANDAIADMKSAFLGIANTVAINVAPSIVNIAGNIQALGQRVRGFVEFASPLLRQFGGLFQTIFSQAWETVRTVFELIGVAGGNTFQSIGDSILGFLINAEFAFKNVGPIAALAWEKLKLGALGFWEDTKFLFTTQLPEAVSWFVDNFTDIMYTGINFVLTTFQNLGKNIRAVWDATVDFFAGRGFNVDWTPLREGFVSTIKELPNISERELTSVEQAMKSRVDQMSQNLQSGLADFTKMRRAELGLDKPPEISAPAGDALASNIGDAISNSVSDGIMKGVEGPQAFQRGSAEAFSAILAAQRGGNPMDKVAKNSEIQTKNQQVANRTLKGIERKIGEIEFVGGEI